MTCLMIFVGCNNIKLEPGVYATENGSSKITLYGDNEFIFNRNIMTSYRPEGSYKVKKGRLILHVTNEEEYTFEIKNGQLIFTECKEVKIFTLL